VSADARAADAASTLAIVACSLRAWPGAEETRLGDWHFRATSGYTRRANSVHPLGRPGVPLAAAVAHVRAWFEARSLPGIFKMTPAACPPELDAFLAEAGWEREAETGVMTADVAAVPRPALPDGCHAVLASAPDPSWLDAFARWHRLGAAAAGTHAWIVSAIRPARAVARVTGPDGEVVSVGLAVADAPHVGLFDLVTDPELRSRGIGRAVVGALVAWGVAQGARQVYLQVEARNEAARRLYAALGFAPAYPYWYRVTPDRGVVRPAEGEPVTFR